MKTFVRTGRWSAGRRVATVWPARDRWVASASAAAYVAVGWRHRNAPRRGEQWVFAALNHGHDDHRLFRVPQQLGTPWVLPALSVAAFAANRPHLAAAAAGALPLEKALEVGFKKGARATTTRPCGREGEVARRRTDGGAVVPLRAHRDRIVRVFLVAPYLPPAVLGAAGLGAVASSLIRVQQGAHYPVDCLGGALLGSTVASGLTAVVGRPAH